MQYIVLRFGWPHLCLASSGHPKEYNVEQWSKRIKEIDEFDKLYSAELAEYHRLREKFSGVETEDE